MSEPDGEHLGPYRLLSTLGSGGFGEVHLALDPEGRTVAVKLLHPHVAADASALTRLEREVETMRLVAGPFVAEVLDASLAGGRPYLVTRYVQGRPLSVVPVPVADLRRLARGLAQALLAVHEAGVVHRDLKPANVMMADGDPVVIDFGIASALDSLSVTASGAVIGTPGYLAPEVLEGHEAGAPADVFSFAATLAYAATGRQPYGTGPLSAVAYRVVHHEADLDGVPAWLEPLLRDCLLQDPEARPTAAQICAVLGADAPARGRHGVTGAGTARRRPALSQEQEAAVLEASGGRAPGVGRFFSVGRRSGIGPSHQGEQDVHDLSTREWRPGTDEHRRSSEESRALHREKVRRRWVIGSAVFVALLAAAARTPLPEVSLLLLATYALVVVADAAVALLSRGLFKVRRMVTDLTSVAGAVALWLALSALFSPFSLALFAVTALVVGVIFLLNA
ncbi:serine/threonine-protein kinase [Nonomuraea sp. NPDC049152]|uniref:serine/threonine-protein kinase n=1 Tax=Nonomuraea sp. NPDC049152 TaxID=3154350 RepID=UPI0033DCCAFB